MRELPELSLDAQIRKAMVGLERIARAHAAPEGLVRAAHGVCACALSVVLSETRGPEASEKATGQLVSALVRLATAAVKAKAPLHSVVDCLVREGEAPSLE